MAQSGNIRFHCFQRIRPINFWTGYRGGVDDEIEWAFSVILPRLRDVLLHQSYMRMNIDEFHEPARTSANIVISRDNGHSAMTGESAIEIGEKMEETKT